MRRAIAGAEVGDDQRGEDPTVQALEARAAELLGHEAAVFLPTATMANQIALKLLSQPGDEVIAESLAHIFRYESGGPAFHSGLMVKRITGHRGLFTPEDVAAAVSDAAVPHFAATRVLALENASNGGGGSVWPIALLREVCAEGRRHELALHLDGSRLLNAAIASRFDAADYGREFDTVTLCLSKGLGCPLGAILACRAELAPRALRLKHLFGGALRQGGIVAAAGLYAFDHHIGRLAEDHAHAKRLAEGLAAAGLPAEPAEVETNFVLLDASAIGLTVAECAARLAREGVLLSPAARQGCLRAVTHLDISSDAIERAIEGALRALAPAAATTG
jgi:threonine aldolase